MPNNSKVQVFSSEPYVTFVVVGWNNKDLIDGCFQSIEKQSYKYIRVVYVDNGSSDGSLGYIKTKYPKVKCINANKNQGFAIGNNIGIKRALQDTDCGFVALLNSDATLDVGWVKTLVSFAQENPKAASLQTPTLDFYDHKVLDSRGIVIDPKGRAMQLGYREQYQKRDSHVVFGVNAAAALLRVDFLNTQPFGHDYFDSDMWMYLEDVDLAARATIMGWQNWYVDGSFAYHMGSASSGKNPGFSVFYIYRNSFPMLFKNLPFSILIRVIPGLIQTDLTTIKDLIRGKNKVALKSMVKGRIYGVLLFMKMIPKRRRLRKKNNIQVSELKELMQHF